MRVLIGASGTGTSFGIISRLRAIWGTEIYLAGVDIFEKRLVTSSNFLDDFFKVCRADSPEYSHEISRLIGDLNIDIFIPILNNEILLAAHLQTDARFKDVQFWSSEIYAKCLDKRFAAELLKTNGVPVPREYDPTGERLASGKWFIKPINGAGSFGAKIINESEIGLIPTAELNNSIIQEICDGPEITVDSFYDRNSGFSRAYCRERIEVKSGVCTKTRIFSDVELSKIANLLGSVINQEGAICFQVMTVDNKYVVTDLNLRSGAGTSMTVNAGFDIIGANFAYRTQKSYMHYLPELEIGKSIYVTRQYSDFVMERE
jgi:carbamoyl-phosphate synthase large subunit